MKLVSLFQRVARAQDTAYVTSPDGGLVRVNEGWTQFAQDNKGAGVLERWQRGAPVFDAIPLPLRDFYLSAFDRALETAQRWEHEYECSSPTHYRRFRMQVYPVDGVFLMFVHSRLVEAAHTDAAHPASADVYERNGVIAMCAHCRRVRNPIAAGRWDWVPEYVALQPTNLSHGLCEPCGAYYFDLGDSALPGDRT